MMKASAFATYNATGASVAAPTGTRMLDHAYVTNRNAGSIYLRIRAVSGGSPTGSNLSLVEIAPGLSLPVPLPSVIAESVWVSASTAADGTGDPATLVGVELRWVTAE